MSLNDILCDPENPLFEVKSSLNNHFHVLKVLNFTKHSLYLIKCREEHKTYIAKPFLHQKHLESRRFTNLLRFSDLLHPNIVHIENKEHSLKIEFAESTHVFDLAFMEPVRFEFKAMIVEGKFQEDPRIIRTWGHHLISGLEYLHLKGIAHLDLKLENLGLDDGYQLKILHFDMAYKKGDLQIVSRGAQNYRAPELHEGRCEDPYAADLFSLGVLLFVMHFNFYPFFEEEYVENGPSLDMLEEEKDMFWAYWEKQIGSPIDKEFKMLIQRLLSRDPKKRGKIEELRQCDWFLKPLYSDKKLIEVVLQEKYDIEQHAFF